MLFIFLSIYSMSSLSEIISDLKEKIQLISLKKKHTRNSTECTDKLYLLRVIHDWTVPKIIFVCKRITWYSKKIPYCMLFVFFWIIFSLWWIQLPWVPLLIIRTLFHQFELLPSMNISKEGNKWFFSNNQRNDAMRLSERVKNHNCV